MTRRPLAKQEAVEPPRAAPPRRPIARPRVAASTPAHGEITTPHQLPEHAPLLTPEQLVDSARGVGPETSLPVGAMLNESAEALDELELIASFDDQRDERRRSRAYTERLEMAIEGALHTLEE